MVKDYKRIGVTTNGYRGEKVALNERVIEGFELATFTNSILRLEDSSPQTIYLTTTNTAEGYYIILPKASNLIKNWKVTIINDSLVDIPIYYYSQNLSNLSLFKNCTSGNMVTCLLLDDTTEQGNWTTFRTQEVTNVTDLDKYISNVYDVKDIRWNQVAQEETSVSVSLGSVLAGYSVTSIYVKTTEQFAPDTLSVKLNVGTEDDPDKFISEYELSNAVADTNFTKDYFEEILSTSQDVDIVATFSSSSNLSGLTSGSVKIVVEKAKVINPMVLNNAIVQTQLPIGTIMNYTFSVEDEDVPSGFWKLDGSVFPKANGAIPDFVNKLNETNNKMSGTEKLIVTESEWQTIFTTYGSCGKFAWVGTGLRFPAINCFVQGLNNLASLSELIPATDINHFHLTGNFNWGSNNGWFTTKSAAVQADMPAGGGKTGWNGSGNGGGHSTESTLSGNQISSLPLYVNQSSSDVHPTSVKYPYIISVYNSIQDSAQLVVDEIIADSVTKANVSLDNLSITGIELLSNLFIPDYAQQVTGNTIGGGEWIQVIKNSFVEVNGTDPYHVDVRAWVSPYNDGRELYQVGYFYNDNSREFTKGTSFTFIVPAGWYFKCNFENGSAYYIYPFKGVN